MKTDPRALRLFLAVCREGTISGAARAAHLSQPSVSVAISQLERSLGVQLFTRHRQGIQLTLAGEALQRRAEAMEQLLDAAQREVQLIGQQIAGPLVIGGTPGALVTLLPLMITPFLQEYPRLQLRILERTEAELHDLLRNYHLDLAISTVGMNTCPDDMEEQQILMDPFSLLAGRANAHLPDEVSLRDLHDAHWVFPDAVGGFRRQIDALFVSAQVTVPRNVIRSDSLLTMKAIVRKTDYVTILPDAVAAAELDSGVIRAIRIREADFQRCVGAIWLGERTLSPVAQAFLDYARRTADL